MYVSHMADMACIMFFSTLPCISDPMGLLGSLELDASFVGVH